MAGGLLNENMRLLQFKLASGQRAVGITGIDGDDNTVKILKQTDSVISLANAAIVAKHSLAAEVAKRGTEGTDSVSAILSEGRALPPVDHPDPAHWFVSGTGLTHLGSATTRDSMHHKLANEESLTDSMKIFKWGVDGGKPASGEIGSQPEWFYKGNGESVVAPGAALPWPSFAEDAGEEPELAALYVIGPDRKPYRIGFALGNEYSDHVMEQRNYLYLAHSKLRYSSYGPEVVVGDFPQHVEGNTQILRDGKVIWEKPFLSGAQNMSHTLENLEFHHFKYEQFLTPGDLHVHFFGTATLSFADGIRTQLGDVFRISAPGFGAALSNPIAALETRNAPGSVVQL